MIGRVLLGLLFVCVVAPGAWAQSVASGLVRDRDGKPIASAFVRQDGALAATFSDPGGRYTLTLSSEGSPVLIISAPGFQDVRVSADQGAAVTLEPLATVVPSFERIPKREEAVASGTRGLETQLTVGYQWGRLAETYQGNTVSGPVDNQIVLDGQLRLEPLLFGVSVERYKTAIALSGFPEGQAPAMTTESLSYHLRVGYLVARGPLTMAPGLGFYNQNLTTADQALTGTPMDLTHARRGLGLTLPLEVALSERFALTARGTYLPWVHVAVPDGALTVPDAELWEASAGIRYAVTPSLSLEVGYRRQAWQRSLQGARDDVRASLSLRPERMP